MDNLFFLVSKIAWALLSPSNLIIFAFFLGTLLLVFKRYTGAKWFLIPSALFAMTIMVYPVSDFLMKPLEERFSKPTELPTGVDGIIILGGGEDLKRSLSWNVAELGQGADRYTGAAELAKNYPLIPVIFSGGSGSVKLQDTGGEGVIAEKILTTIGINQQRLIIESKSRNTFENFKYIKPLLPKQDGKYIVVTSAYHMPRAVGIARQLDINVVPYPVDYRTNSDALRGVDFDFYDHLRALEPAWKEWIGLTVYYLTDRTNAWFPKPASNSQAINKSENQSGINSKKELEAKQTTHEIKITKVESAKPTPAKENTQTQQQSESSISTNQNLSISDQDPIPVQIPSRFLDHSKL